MAAPSTTILDIAQHYAEDILLPNRLSWEKSGTQPMDLFQLSADSGLLGLETAVSDGGLGASFTDKIAVAQKLSEFSMAAIFALFNSQNIAARIRREGAPAHHIALADGILAGERVGCTALTEPHAGSDFAAIKTNAEKVDGGWRLNGSKAWITNMANADVIMLYAQTNPELGWKGIASFLIDGRKDGFKRGEIYNLIGGQMIGAGEFQLDDYFASDEDMIAPPGEAFKAAMTSINGARTYVAAMCAGMITNALELVSARTSSRTAFNQTLISFQGLRWSLADVMTQLEGLKLHIEKSTDLIDRGEDAILAAAMAKKVAGDITVPALTACMQAMGAEGLKESYFLGQHLACAKIGAFTDGSTEMMNERIGGYLPS